MGNYDKDDEKVLDELENFRSGEENKFNHQVLVMQALKTCLEKGAVEMKEGFWETKVTKNGDGARVYHEDTRRVFIEAVKSLMMITHVDYKDLKPFNNRIEALKEEVKKKKIYWLQQEWNWWCSLSPQQKQQALREGKHANQGSFNPNLQFDNFFYSEELDIYREICTLINDMTKELNYYGNDGNFIF